MYNVCTYTRVTHTHTHAHAYLYVYIRMHVPNLPTTRPCLHPRPRVSECRHVCARERASAVPLRTTGCAASTTRPSASTVVRAAGPGAAHTANNVVTDAVFHAPMFALNADAEANTCAPKPHAVHADGQGLARLRVSGFRPSPQHEPANACAQPIHHHRTLVQAQITPTDSYIYR